MSGKSTIDGGNLPATDDYALVLAQERLVVEAQVSINRLLRDAGLKQSDLAALLGVSEARVSQMFGDNARNLTLRTLARIFHVLGSRCRIVSEAEMNAKVKAATDSGAVVPGAAEGLRPSAEAPPSTAPATSAIEAEVDTVATRVADAWLLDGRDIFAVLSEDAPFASRMVWVSDHKAVPANENHPDEAMHGRRGGADARLWAAAQDQYAFG